VRANNGSVLISAAEEGLGVTMQPAFIASRALDAGTLLEVLPAYEWPGLSLYAVYPQTRHLSAKARALIDYLRMRLSGARAVWDRAPASGPAFGR
ncbi:MAG: LysR substrate-binding domain-containing protein, partial [Pseudomonadota bacterium]